MMKITLGQLLQYYDREQDPDERLQVVVPGLDWECADELSVHSPLLSQYRNADILDIRSEESYSNRPIIRVLLDL